MSAAPEAAAAMAADMARCAALVRARGLPGVEEAASYGTPALRTARRAFCRMKEPGVLVVAVALEEKEALLADRPEAWFETEHYRGWPWALLRLSAVDDAELAARLERAWRDAAPRREAKAWDARAAKEE